MVCYCHEKRHIQNKNTNVFLPTPSNKIESFFLNIMSLYMDTNVQKTTEGGVEQRFCQEMR